MRFFTSWPSLLLLAPRSSLQLLHLRVLELGIFMPKKLVKKSTVFADG
jgi:hypothetical protein